MASVNATMGRMTTGRRISSAALSAPRMIMSWEDWLTLGAAFITFISVAASIQQANWVKDMPTLIPTAMTALIIGLIAARIRAHGLFILPMVVVLGIAVVILTAQPYAEGASLAERLTDFRFRMSEWWAVVWAGDISNDNLPFVASIHTLTFIYCVLAAWSIYRWHNVWLAIVPAGFVLLSNISFMDGHPTAAFIVYLFGALMLISRLHIQGSQTRWNKEGTAYPDWISLSTLNLTTALTVVLIVVAWVIPLGAQAATVEAVVERVIQPIEGQTEHAFRLFHNVDSRKGARLHTFGDTLPIQGDIDLGTKILLEVRADDLDVIRGASYNEYTGNGWKSTDRDRERVENAELAATESYASVSIHQLNVRVIDRESTLLTPGIPLGSNLDTYVEVPEEFGGDIERMDSRKALDDGDSYNSVGWVSRATEAELRAAGSEYPDWVIERYLQLPDSLPTRVSEKSAEVAGDAPTSFDQATAIETFLRALPYDPAVEAPPPGRDAVDYLLFDLQRGYFDYQASAMAVMLRSLGVPARVAVGYTLDPADIQGTRFSVRKDDAYSWVEVFFPRYGWVTFNPTQDQPAGGAGGIQFSSPGLDALDELLLDDLFDLLDGPLQADDAPFDALNEPAIIRSDGRTIPWLWIMTFAAILAAAGTAGLAGRLTWNWGLSGLDARSAMWEKVQRLSRYAGFGSRPQETPHEWSERLGSGIGLEEETRLLGQAFEESQYGRPDLVRTDEEETTRSYVSIRNGLLAVILRRGKKKREED